MRGMDVKKIILLFVTITSTIFMLWVTNPSFDVNINESIDLMRKVESYDEAIQLSYIYDVDFVSYSDYGFATYQSTANMTSYLLEEGFIIEGVSIQTSYEINAHMDDPYSNQQYAIDLMELESTWNYSTGSTSIVIAVIDSGIDTDHEEFGGKISPLSYNSRTKQVGLSYIEDDTGHGTMVAGIIGAKHNNFKGIKGVMAQTTLLIIKANNIDNPSTPDQDESTLYADSSIIEGIYYAVEHGAHVINLSLGGKSANPLTEEAVEYATSQGVIVVAASGNDGTNEKLYPASFDDVISVSSVGQTKLISSFSNFNHKVDISAPGEAIVTTYTDNDYVSASGTSFAAPQVSGIIGLLLAHKPNQTPAEIFHRITTTAMDQGVVGKDDYYGYGVINAYQAIKLDYFIVTFDTQGGTIIDSIMVQSNQTFSVTNPLKEGYTFEGWYLDQAYTQPFQMGVNYITADTTLYAKYLINHYTVTLIGFNGEISIQTLPYQSIFNDDPDQVIGYHFMGWYYQSSFDTPAVNHIVTSDITLYAKYEINIYTIFYFVDGNKVFEETINHGEIPHLYEPNPYQMTILGWYTDSLLLFPYTPEAITNHLVLYGKVDYTMLHVTYYDYDQTTVLLYEVVSFGESVLAPEAPIKPSSASLSFVFTGWSDESSIVTSNKQIYPIYELIYHPETIYLLPGIDTIYLGEDWIDSSISLNDSSLRLESTGEVDVFNPGRYLMIYRIYYGEIELDVFVRSIHVIQKEEIIDITIQPTITTLYQGDTYIEKGAISSVGEVVIIGEVDTQTPGIYQIIYQVMYREHIRQKSLYVYVLEREVIPIDTLYFSKENEVVIL